MRKLSVLATAAVLAVLMAVPAAADAKGDDIAAKHFGRAKAADTSSDAVMTLIDKSGNKKVRELQMSTKDTPAGAYSFVEFTKPADVAGTKFLTTPTKDGNEQRLYLPALKKTRKIASSDKTGEFVNSDLFYYDMEDRKLEDYSYTFLAEGETLTDKAFAGLTFYKIEAKPKAENSPYSESIFWVGSTDYEIYKIEAYDKTGGALLKTFLFVKFDPQKGLKTPVQTMVTNHKKGTKTLLQLNNLKVNSGLKDEVFSVKNLEQ